MVAGHGTIEVCGNDLREKPFIAFRRARSRMLFLGQHLSTRHGEIAASELRDTEVFVHLSDTDTNVLSGACGLTFLPRNFMRLPGTPPTLFPAIV